MEENRRVKGFNFKWNSDTYSDEGYYECRGEVCYDDEHDEMPEPALWRAAILLEKELASEGFFTDVEYSEKGWVYVQIINKE